MTVDMLAATFFWPEGTSLQVREDIEPDGESESRSADQAADPSAGTQGETFWAAVLRQTGWRLPSRAT